MSKIKNAIRETSPLRLFLIIIYLVTIITVNAQALPQPSIQNVTIELGPDANITIFVGSN